MDWIVNFQWLFIVPAGLLIFLFGSSWLSDNASSLNGPGYRWKRWTVQQTVDAFLIGPAAGFLLVGLAMIFDLSRQQFIFERWWLAVSCLVVAIWLIVKYCRHFFSEVFSKKNCTQPVKA